MKYEFFLVEKSRIDADGEWPVDALYTNRGAAGENGAVLFPSAAMAIEAAELRDREHVVLNAKTRDEFLGLLWSMSMAGFNFIWCAKDAAVNESFGLPLRHAIGQIENWKEAK